jgi:hypothetical protein
MERAVLTKMEKIIVYSSNCKKKQTSPLFHHSKTLGRENTKSWGK